MKPLRQSGLPLLLLLHSSGGNGNAHGGFVGAATAQPTSTQFLVAPRSFDVGASDLIHHGYIANADLSSKAMEWKVTNKATNAIVDARLAKFTARTNFLTEVRIGYPLDQAAVLSHFEQQFQGKTPLFLPVAANAEGVAQNVAEGVYKIELVKNEAGQKTTLATSEALVRLKKSVRLLVETDKPRYKPGDEVKLRLVTLFFNQAPSAAMSTTVPSSSVADVFAPFDAHAVMAGDAAFGHTQSGGARVIGRKLFAKCSLTRAADSVQLARLEDDEVAENLGVAEFQFPIVKEAQEGQYAVRCDLFFAAAGRAQQQPLLLASRELTIAVEKYVLPKYSVEFGFFKAAGSYVAGSGKGNVYAKDYLVVKRDKPQAEDHVGLFVSAMYTHGSPVKGDVSARVFGVSRKQTYTYLKEQRTSGYRNEETLTELPGLRVDKRHSRSEPPSAANNVISDLAHVEFLLPGLLDEVRKKRAAERARDRYSAGQNWAKILVKLAVTDVALGTTKEVRREFQIMERGEMLTLELVDKQTQSPSYALSRRKSGASGDPGGAPGPQPAAADPLPAGLVPYDPTYATSEVGSSGSKDSGFFQPGVPTEIRVALREPDGGGKVVAKPGSTEHVLVTILQSLVTEGGVYPHNDKKDDEATVPQAKGETVKEHPYASQAQGGVYTGVNAQPPVKKLCDDAAEPWGAAASYAGRGCYRQVLVPRSTGVATLTVTTPYDVDYQCCDFHRSTRPDYQAMRTSCCIRQVAFDVVMETYNGEQYGDGLGETRNIVEVFDPALLATAGVAPASVLTATDLFFKPPSSLPPASAFAGGLCLSRSFSTTGKYLKVNDAAVEVASVADARSNTLTLRKLQLYTSGFSALTDIVGGKLRVLVFDSAQKLLGSGELTVAAPLPLQREAARGLSHSSLYSTVGSGRGTGNKKAAGGGVSEALEFADVKIPVVGSSAVLALSSVDVVAQAEVVVGGRFNLGQALYQTTQASLQSNNAFRAAVAAAGVVQSAVAGGLVAGGGAGGGLPDSLALSFDKSEVKPGDSVSVEVKYSGNLESLLPAAESEPTNARFSTYILAIDRSVELLEGARQELSLAQLTEEITKNAEETEAGPDAPKIAPPVYAQCSQENQDFLFKYVVQGQAKPAGGITLPCPREIGYAACGGGGGFGMFGGGGDMMMMEGMAMADGGGPMAMAAAPRGGAAPEMMTKSAAAPAGAQPPGGGGSSGAAAPAVKVRSFFPETWLWTRIESLATYSLPAAGTGARTCAARSFERTDAAAPFSFKTQTDYRTNACSVTATPPGGGGGAVTERYASSVSFPRTAPDTITTFKLFGFGARVSDGNTGAQLVLQDAAAAGANPALRVFKPVFIAMALPYEGVRNEEFEITITVFNYHDAKDLTNARLEIELRNGLRPITDSDGNDSLVAALGFRKIASFSAALPGTVNLDVKYEKTIASLRKNDFFQTKFFVSSAKAGAATVQGKIVPAAADYSGSAEFALLSDAMVKPLNVQPEGVAQEQADSAVVFFEAQEGASGALSVTKELELDVKMPANEKGIVVANSVSVHLATTAQMLGNDLVSNLDRLLRTPSGCGEQNMLGLTPNVAAGLMFRAKGLFTGKTKKKILSNFMTGVQRELNYVHTDGSFSAFGPSRASSFARRAEEEGQAAAGAVRPKSDYSGGSSWLTAFVLRVFADIDEFVAVDRLVMEKAALFVLDYQHTDGAFARMGQVCHSEMQGGYMDGVSYTEKKKIGQFPPALTAYIVLALQNYEQKVLLKPDSGASAGLRAKVAGGIAKGLAFLTANKASESVYEKILRLKIESRLHGADPARAAGVVSELMALSETKLVKGVSTLFFPQPKPPAPASPAAGAPLAKRRRAYCVVPGPVGVTPTDIEQTGYALQILTELAQTGPSLQTVGWLAAQRRPSGGFIQTQDTVVALDGLARYETTSSNGIASFFDDNDVSIAVALVPDAASSALKVSGKMHALHDGAELAQMSVAKGSRDVLQQGRVAFASGATGGASASYAVGGQQSEGLSHGDLFAPSDAVDDGFSVRKVRVTATLTGTLSAALAADVTVPLFVTLSTSYNLAPPEPPTLQELQTMEPTSYRLVAGWVAPGIAAVNVTAAMAAQAATSTAAPAARRLAGGAREARLGGAETAAARAPRQLMMPIGLGEDFGGAPPEESAPAAAAAEKYYAQVSDGKRTTLNAFARAEYEKGVDKKGLEPKLDTIFELDNTFSFCVERKTEIAKPPADSNPMLLVRVAMFSGFSVDQESFACPVSRCEVAGESGTSDAVFYLNDFDDSASSDGKTNDGSGHKVTEYCVVNIPVLETSRVQKRKPRVSSVIEYYNPGKEFAHAVAGLNSPQVGFSSFTATGTPRPGDSSSSSGALGARAGTSLFGLLLAGIAATAAAGVFW